MKYVKCANNSRACPFFVYPFGDCIVSRRISIKTDDGDWLSDVDGCPIETVILRNGNIYSPEVVEMDIDEIM
jgi:hypothetical protein